VTFGTRAVDPGAIPFFSSVVFLGGDPASLASPPDYLLRPQYQTREQKRLMALEGQIGDLAAFLKGMQARMDEQHQSMKKALEANTSVLHEPIGWKPKVQADVEELQSSVRELCTKVDHLAVKQEEVTNSAYRVFDTEHLNLTGSATTDLPGKPCGATSGPSGHGDETIHQGSGNGVVTTLIPTPVTGVRNTKTLTPVAFPLGHAYSPEFTQYHLNHALPTVEFPEFDGSSPKLWIKKVQQLFLHV